MKKVIMVLALLCSMSVMAVIPLNLPRLCLSLRIIDPTDTGNPRPRSPYTPPSVAIDEQTLYFESEHAVFTLVLVNEDGEEVYEAIIPSNMEEVTLPSTLSGEYEMRLYTNDCYFYCVILL